MQVDVDKKDEAQAPTVSLGMPVYNGADYLEQALESIMAQTSQDFELIICDNASTAATRKICEAHAAKDSRIHYHRNLLFVVMQTSPLVTYI